MLVVTAFVALAAGAGAGAAVRGSGDHHAEATATHEPHGGGMSLGSHAMDEREFLRQMVPHHEAAIVMAELARTKGRHTAVRQLAEDIIAAQETEITDMQGWYRAWYGEELVPSAEGMLHGADMAGLETATGDAFDRAFVRMMVAHHAGAIVMAEAVMMRSPPKDVAMLADEITAAQAKEIGRMQRWREAWFPPLG